MRSIVVLGTGTNVGKTYATCQIAAILTAAKTSPRVLALKPIETGVNLIEDTDAAKLGTASVPSLPPQHAYAFKPPISAHLAARLDGIKIDVARVVQWIDDRCECGARSRLESDDHGRSDPRGWVLIETAGGALSPINEKHTKS